MQKTNTIPNPILFQITSSSLPIEKAETVDSFYEQRAQMASLSQSIAILFHSFKRQLFFCLALFLINGDIQAAEPPIQSAKWQGHFFHYDFTDGVISDPIEVIFQDSKDRIWVGGRLGLGYFDGLAWHRLKSEDGFPTQNIGAIFEDRDGNMWFGTARGISRFDGQNWENFLTDDQRPQRWTRALMQDRQGNIWVADRYTLLKYDGKQWHQYAQTERAGKALFAEMVRDRSGTIWCATRGAGVHRFKGNTWKMHKRMKNA